MKVDIDFKLTDSAIERVKDAMKQSSSEGNMLRVFVQGGGCSGTTYGMAFVERNDFDPLSDITQEFGGVLVVVDKKGLFMLDGISVDWDESSSGFKFSGGTQKSCCKKSCS
jgi:iron-sulfur cluster assembly protein